MDVFDSFLFSSLHALLQVSAHPCALIMSVPNPVSLHEIPSLFLPQAIYLDPHFRSFPMLLHEQTAARPLLSCNRIRFLSASGYSGHHSIWGCRPLHVDQSRRHQTLRLRTPDISLLFPWLITSAAASTASHQTTTASHFPLRFFFTPALVPTQCLPLPQLWTTKLYKLIGPATLHGIRPTQQHPVTIQGHRFNIRRIFCQTWIFAHCRPGAPSRPLPSRAILAAESS